MHNVSNIKSVTKNDDNPMTLVTDVPILIIGLFAIEVFLSYNLILN